MKNQIKNDLSQSQAQSQFYVITIFIIIFFQFKNCWGFDPLVETISKTSIPVTRPPHSQWDYIAPNSSVTAKGINYSQSGNTMNLIYYDRDGRPMTGATSLSSGLNAIGVPITGQGLPDLNGVQGSFVPLERIAKDTLKGFVVRSDGSLDSAQGANLGNIDYMSEVEVRKIQISVNESALNQMSLDEAMRLDEELRWEIAEFGSLDCVNSKGEIGRSDAGGWPQEMVVKAMFTAAHDDNGTYYCGGGVKDMLHAVGLNPEKKMSGDGDQWYPILKDHSDWVKICCKPGGCPDGTVLTYNNSGPQFKDQCKTGKCHGHVEIEFDNPKNGKKVWCAGLCTSGHPGGSVPHNFQGAFIHKKYVDGIDNKLLCSNQ